MKFNSKLFLLVSVFSVVSFTASSQVVITIQTDSIVNKMAAGFGANTFAMLDSVPVVVDNKGSYRSWGGSAWGATPEASDDKAWSKIFSYMDWLGMDYTRLNVEHRMFEPEKGKYSFDNREMMVLYKYLDYFEKNGVTVQLQEMYPNVKWLAYNKLQSDAVGIIKSGPSDIEAWSDGIIALLKHLLVDKKYTCIQYLGIANEPHHGWSWWKEADGRTSQSIIPALTLLRSKIQKEKIPVLLTGPEEMFYFWEVKDSQEKYTKLVDAFTYHEYMTINDWWDNRESKDWNPTLKLFTEPVKTAVKIAHDNIKPFFFSEHGTMQFGLTRDDRGPSMHAAMLKDVEFAVRYSNLGVDGFSRWSLLNRNNLDGQWGFIETFDRKTMKLLDPEKYLPKENTFYGYGMLTRFIYRKSSVVKSEITYYYPEDSISALHVAAYVSPEKTHTTIVVVNDKQETFNTTIAVQGKDNYKTWYKYRFSYNQRNRNDIQINPLQEIKGKKIEDKIPGLSITVYSTKKLLQGDKGLVNE
jgi:hypothetical protein